MLFAPCPLHDFVVRMNIPCFVAQFAQVAGVEIRDAEQAIDARLHLLVVWLLLQARMLGIKPVEEVRVVGVEEEEFQTTVFATCT